MFMLLGNIINVKVCGSVTKESKELKLIKLIAQFSIKQIVKYIRQIYKRYTICFILLP